MTPLEVSVERQVRFQDPSPKKRPLVINESSFIETGTHVRVGPIRPDGKPHPHAGKTGRITRLINWLSEPYYLGLPSAMVKLDPGIEPRGFIWVSLRCLEVLP
jgi:hypothetical protein